MVSNRRANVLIVDDSRSALHALRNYLSALNVEIAEAEDGVQGWKIVQENDFDLVITDVDMPEMNGFELCEKIKNTKRLSEIPVVILSARQDEASIEQGFKVGASAFVSKIDASVELIPQVENCLISRSFLRDRLILVVEDSDSIREIVSNELRNVGFRVETASDGVEALESIEKNKPDLVLADLNMPNLGGASLCRILQGNEEYSKIPLVIMSSNDDRMQMRKLIHQGAASYVTKPFNPVQLVITIEKILSDHFRLLLEEKQHMQNEQRLTMGAISSLVNALEARDVYTRGHSENVALVSVAIGRHLGLDELELEELELMGRLHDLGKIGIRDKVLLKDDRLTDAEYEHIKTHTTVVADILKPMGCMEKIMEAATSHHERWDGKGYPRGLKGEDIPFYARIIAVADVFDALSSDRPYRKGMSVEETVEAIKGLRGTQLCPTCLDAFIECMDDINNASCSLLKKSSQ